MAKLLLTLPMARISVNVECASVILPYIIRLFVLSGVARLLAVLRRAFQPLPVLTPRPGPMHFPSNTWACTVYFKSQA